MFKFVMTKNSIELFHRAILSNDLPRTKLILEEAMKDPRFDIDEINEEGLTALQFSCFAGNLDIVKVLVSYKADVKKRDRDGNTLLHAASLAGQADVIKYLLRSGLKPTVRNDDNQMPIEASDEVAVIVILLRAMLDQGYLEEMQEYMIDHPKLKRNIFKELERVKCRENEKNEILKDLPYSSHTSPRRQVNRPGRVPSDEMKGRSLSTFSKLSDSMQQLDQISPRHHVAAQNDRNNNYKNYHRNSIDYSSNDAAPSLKRHNSTSSTSSHGSRGSGAGILRHDNGDYETRHRSTQHYLENRFPSNASSPTASKSVSFELEHPANHRNYSDGYISDTYDDKLIPVNNNRRSLSRSSSISSHSSNHTGVFSDTCSNFDFPQQPLPPQQPRHQPPPPQQQLHRKQQEEAIYANVQSLNIRPATLGLSTISEGESLYENLPLRNKPAKSNAPPPLPPRQPSAQSPAQQQQQQQQYSHGSPYEYDNGVDPNFPPYTTVERGSETDSGIDINETAGRVFALSLDDQKDIYNYNNMPSPGIEPQQNPPNSYSKPIGIYYSGQMNSTTVRQDNGNLDNLRPTGANQLNPKYRSWNGRTLLESHQKPVDNVTPYSSHTTRRHSRHSQDDFDAYNRTQQPMYQAPERRSSNMELRQFNFDHQPEIML